MERKRIFITGASGTGKTTLARWISNRYSKPFISSSAKKVWPKFGIADHRDAIVKSYNSEEFCWGYQSRIFVDRQNSISLHENFVTDRSPFDNFAYMMTQGGELMSNELTQKMAEALGSLFEPGDLVLFLRFNELTELKDDSYRLFNKHAQYMADGAIDTVIRQNLIKHKDRVRVIHLTMWDWEKRLEYLKSPGIWESK